MPCLIGCLALATTRLAIVLVVIFSDFIGRAYQTTLWPLLGFFSSPSWPCSSTWGFSAVARRRAGGT